MFQLLFCYIGRHRRSDKRRSRGADGRMRSECCGCGVPLVHNKDGGGWSVDTEASNFAIAS